MEGLADQITCPLLIVHGVNDFIMDPEGAQELHASAGGSPELRMWGEGGRGGRHLSYDDISIVLPFMFDWLADQLDAQTEGGAQ